MTRTALIYWVLFASFLVAGDDIRLNKKIRFEHITTEQSIADYRILSILQDRQGWMWFGTQNGLLRFDGHSFQIWRNNPGQPNVLAGDEVQCLLESEAGDLWVGTDNGLSLFHRETETFTHFLPQEDAPDKLQKGTVLAMIQDSTGLLWLALKEGGVFSLDLNQPLDTPNDVVFTRYKLEKGQKTWKPGSLISNWVYSFCLDRSGTLWIGTLGGLMVCKPNGVPEPYSLDLPEELSRQVLAITEDRHGYLWMGLKNYFLRYDRKTGEVIAYRQAVADLGYEGTVYPRAMVVDHDDRLWIATFTHGLLLFDPAEGSLEGFLPDYLDHGSIGSNTLSSLAVDQTGLLWIGTKDKGIYMHNPETRRFGHAMVRQKVKEQQDPAVTAIHQEASGRIWLAGRQGLSRFEPDGTLVEHLSVDTGPRSIGSGQVSSLLSDFDDNLWVGTFTGGLTRLPLNPDLPGRRYMPVEGDPDSLGHMGINCLYMDRQQRIWIGTRSSGLDVFQNGRFTHFNSGKQPGSISDPDIRDLTGDAHDRLWVATGRGLCYREGERFISLFNDPSDSQTLDSDNIFSICSGRDGSVWVGTNHGLNRVTMVDGTPVMSRYGEADGLAGGILDIQEDHNGMLWISTIHGLIRFNPQQRHSRLYGPRDGMQSEWFIQGSSFKNSKGHLFFGGEMGFNRFNPGTIHDHTTPPPVVLTELFLFNEPLDHTKPGSPLPTPISLTEKVTFTHNQNFIDLKFAALDYATPERNRFAYRMDGLHDEWRYTAGAKNHVSYNSLLPGNYTFYVRGTNRDGFWQETPRRLMIEITPPLWASPWAFTFYALVLFGLVAAYIRHQKQRLAKERRLNESLDQMVSERTRDLEERNAEVLHQQQQLREMDALKTRFFTNLSHEFRTPLTLMVGPVEDLLDQEEPEPAKTRKVLQTTRRHAMNLLKMINELLDVSKLAAGQMTLHARSLDLAAFVSMCAAPFQAMEGRGPRLTLKGLDHPVPVFFDPGKLDKVFSNLIMNAVKHLDHNGLIVVSLEETDTEVRISVKDNGPGIPADQLPHIFDRFYQAESGKKGQGTGIGLSLAQELVHLHGGHIEVAGEFGFGCTFTVTLRKGQAHLSPEQLVVDAMPPPNQERGRGTEPNEAQVVTADDHVTLPKGRLNLLVIEDNDEVRAYLQDTLQQTYNVRPAASGREGLTAALEHIPDLMICDVMLPDMDGLDICRQIKKDERTSHIPIIVLTARTTADQNIAGLEAGADAYITKPFSSRILRSQIRNLIRNRRLLQDRFSQKITAAATDVEMASGEEAFLHKVVGQMEQNMGDAQFGVNELAMELGMSRRQLHRKITATTGKTPSEIFRGIRLAHAAQLLQKNTDQVSQIAYAVGFSKTQHFSKVFRETYGCNPSEYAARHKTPPGA